MKILLLISIFIMGCSSSSEEPIIDFKIDSKELTQARIAGIVTEVSHAHGYSVATNNPETMARLSNGESTVSVWITSGNKNVGNVVTVNQGGEIRVMIFASGIKSKSDAKLLERDFREAFK